MIWVIYIGRGLIQGMKPCKAPAFDHSEDHSSPQRPQEEGGQCPQTHTLHEFTLKEINSLEERNGYEHTSYSAIQNGKMLEIIQMPYNKK